jgi:hypothetical protein
MALLLFRLDCAFRPCELMVIPVALIGLFLCRSAPTTVVPWLRSLGMTIAVFAIVFAFVVAAFVRWGFALSSGGFP